MGSDPTRIELHLHADARFLPGVAGAVAHFADRAGLEPAAQAALTAAAEEAFRGVAPLLESREAMLEISVADFADRVEVTFEHQGRPWAVSGNKMFSQADRVQHDSRGNFSRLVLTKYVRSSV